MNTSKVIDFLLDAKILRFGEFKLASGRVSPYYFNLRALSDFTVAHRIGDLFAGRINEDIGLESFDTLFGIAYAGILLCYLAAECLWRSFGVKKRFAYNRKEPKAYGDPRNKLIAGGQFNGDDRLLLIDDVLTTGETKLRLKKQLEEAFPNTEFRGLIVFLDRYEIDETGSDARQALEKIGLPVFSVLSAPQIVNNPSNISTAAIGDLRKYLQTYGRKGIQIA